MCPVTSSCEFNLGEYAAIGVLCSRCRDVFRLPIHLSRHAPPLAPFGDCSLLSRRQAALETAQLRVLGYT